MDDMEEAFDLGVGKARGRLVEGDHLEVLAAVRLHDLDHLLIGDAQVLDLVGRLDVQTEIVNDFLRLFVQLLGFDLAERAGRKPTEVDVFADGELEHDLALLINHADAGGDRLGRAVEVARLTVDKILAAGLLVVAV